jgi:hypothetical protein
VAVLTEALFEAYLDEGGTHAGSPILSVAGYFGLHEQWSKFLDRWPHAEFHACEPKYDHLKPSLADAIDYALLPGTEVCIRPDMFKEHANGDIKAHLGNAYAVGAFLCAVIICDKAQAIVSNARVSFVLEDGQPNIDWVRRMLISMMLEYPIASVTVAQKSDFPQLHPADFLAHSRAITDTPWLNRLFGNAQVNEIAVDGKTIADTSAQVARFMKRYRGQKMKERRTRKKRANAEGQI